MLKRKLFKRICIIAATLLSIILIIIFPNKDDELNFEVSNLHIDTGIYLLNKDEVISRIPIYYDSKNDIDLIYEILAILTIDDGLSYKIKTGFKGIIPKNTKVLDVTKDKDIITINFSKDILNIRDDLEVKMIECIVYSILSNIDGIKLKLLVEGSLFKQLPHSKVLLPELLDKSIKINKVYDINGLDDVKYITVYYPCSEDDFNYYIPVTNVVNSKNEKIEIIIDELKSSSTYNTNVISYINEETELIDYQILEDSILLNFNDLIFDIDSNKILEEVRYSINLSIKDNYDVSSVMYMVDDKIIDNYFLLLG